MPPKSTDGRRVNEHYLHQYCGPTLVAPDSPQLLGSQLIPQFSLVLPLDEVILIHYEEGNK